jgi:hypothetical protein
MELVAIKEEPEKAVEFKLAKITNPNWLGILAPQIKIFCEKLNLPTITYETLYTYFLRTIQHGGDNIEFWVVLKDDEVIAFAHWFVNGLPQRGAVSCDYIYSWNRMREPIELLIEKFIKFGKENHAPIYTGTAIGEAVFRVFRKAGAKQGLKFEKTSLIDFRGRLA